MSGNNDKGKGKARATSDEIASWNQEQKASGSGSSNQQNEIPSSPRNQVVHPNSNDYTWRRAQRSEGDRRNQEQLELYNLQEEGSLRLAFQADLGQRLDHAEMLAPDRANAPLQSTSRSLPIPTAGIPIAQPRPVNRPRPQPQFPPSLPSMFFSYDSGVGFSPQLVNQPRPNHFLGVAGNGRDFPLRNSAEASPDSNNGSWSSASRISQAGLSDDQGSNGSRSNRSSIGSQLPFVMDDVDFRELAEQFGTTSLSDGNQESSYNIEQAEEFAPGRSR